VTADLFGERILEWRWGRIGGIGQHRSASFPTNTSAEAAASALIRAKERRGYRVAA
jgi:predicted DNA-binding WGR domain protein